MELQKLTNGHHQDFQQLEEGYVLFIIIFGSIIFHQNKKEFDTTIFCWPVCSPTISEAKQTYF